LENSHYQNNNTFFFSPKKLISENLYKNDTTYENKSKNQKFSVEWLKNKNHFLGENFFSKDLKKISYNNSQDDFKEIYNDFYYTVVKNFNEGNKSHLKNGDLLKFISVKTQIIIY